LGLGGAKRLVNEFAIESEPGKGTKVMILRWR
jgi:serine/threonine-protein kinase RsbT